MTCRNCGRKLATIDRYCAWCGEAQFQADITEPDDDASPEEQLRQLREIVLSQNADLERLSERLAALESHDVTPAAPGEPEAPLVAPMAPEEPEAPLVAPTTPEEPEAPLVTPASPAAPETSLVAPTAPEEPEAPLVTPASPEEPEAPLVAPMAPEEPEAPLVAPMAPEEPEAPLVAPMAPEKPEAPLVAPIAPEEPEAALLAPMAPEEPEAPLVAPMVPEEREAPLVAPMAPEEPEAPLVAPTAPEPEPPTASPAAPRERETTVAATPASDPTGVLLGRESSLPPAIARVVGSGGAESGGRPPDRTASSLADWNWEWLLGGNWLARIGMVALILGVAFFISLAIDRGWLGEAERAILGVLAGLAFMGAGEYYRTRYAVWAQTVAGGGLAILYLAIYGAFALYGLLSPVVAFGLFALITLAGVLQALRQESVGLAVLAIFGGFATPLLLQQRLPDERLLLAYVLLLDMGVLALAGFRNWRWFTLLAWTGSLILFAFWLERLEPSTALSQIGITGIFLIFAGATFAFHVVRRQAAGVIDLALLTANAIAYLLISYGLMYDEYRPWMGGFTAALAAFYVLLVALCGIRAEASREVVRYGSALAVAFAALAVPVQLDGQWVSAAWGVEAIALVWLSFRLRTRELRWFGYAVFLVSAVWLLSVDTPGAFREDFTPFWNRHMVSYGAAIILPALASYLLHRRREALEPLPNLQGSTLVRGTGLFLPPLAHYLTDLGREAIKPAERVAIALAAVWAAIFATIAVPLQLDGIWIGVGWAIEAALLVWLSFPLRVPQLRWSGYVVFAVSGAWLLAVDTPPAFREDLTPFLNLPMLAYGAAIALPALAGYLLHRHREALPGERGAIPVAAVWAAIFATIAVPLQLDGLWISVVWGVEAAVLVWLSFLLSVRELRWFAYLVFLVSATWLLAVDTPDAFREDFTPFLNLYMLSYAAAVILPALAGYLLYRSREAVNPWERKAVPVAAVWAATFAAIAVPVQLDGLWIAVTWGIEALLLVWLSFPLRIRELRWSGYLLFLVSAIRLLAVDTPDALREDITPFLNLHMLSYAAAIVLPALAGYVVYRRRAALEPWERRAIPVSAVWAALFAAIAVPVQLDGIWLSLAWGIEAVVLVWLSFALGMREVRWSGYMVLAVSAVWLLAVDTPDAFREDLTPFLNLYMLSYAAAVILPALAGYLVHRHREAPGWELVAIPVAAVWAAFFAAIAVPVQLDGIWVTVAWGIEAVVLVWLSFALGIREVRWSGYMVLAVSAVWLLAVDTPDAVREDLTPFLNLPILGYATAVIAPVFAGYLVHRHRELLAGREAPVIPVAAVWAALFAVIAVPVQLSGAWIAVGWAIEAVVLLVGSDRLRLGELRWFTYLLLIVMLVRLLAMDTTNLDLDTFRPVANWRFLSFAAGIASLYAALYLVRLRGADFASTWVKDEARTASMVLFAVATLVALWILSAEVLASADSALFDLSADASDNVSILGLTLLWGIYGAALMLVGVLKRWRLVRVVGLGLLLVSVVKLFAYDSQALEQIYRVIAFLTLGMILLAGGLLYQRYSGVVRGFLFE